MKFFKWFCLLLIFVFLTTLFVDTLVRYYQYVENTIKENERLIGLGKIIDYEYASYYDYAGGWLWIFLCSLVLLIYTIADMIHSLFKSKLIRKKIQSNLLKETEEKNV